MRRQCQIAARVAIVAAIAMVAASCGGGSKDPGKVAVDPGKVAVVPRAQQAEKVALAVRADYPAGNGLPQSVDCQELRDAVLNGRIVTFYSCKVDGALHPPAGPVCYAFANDAVMRVPRLGLGCKGER